MEVLYHLSYSPEERLNLAADPSETGRPAHPARRRDGRFVAFTGRPTKPASSRLAAAKKSAFASITLWNWPKSSKLTRPNSPLHAASARTTTASGTSPNVPARRSRSARSFGDGAAGSVAGGGGPPPRPAGAS